MVGGGAVVDDHGRSRAQREAGHALAQRHAQAGQIVAEAERGPRPQFALRLVGQEDGRTVGREDVEDDLVHPLVDAQHGKEGAARDSSCENRADDSRRLAIGVRLPGVHGGEAHLGAVTDEEEHEGRVQPARVQMRGLLDQFAEQERRFLAGVERRVGKEERTEECQGDADGADEQILPGCLQRARVMVEVDGRRAHQRRRWKPVAGCR